MMQWCILKNVFLVGRANPRDLARFSLISSLKIGKWSLPNLDVRSNDAMVHFEEGFLGWPRKSSGSRAVFAHFLFENRQVVAPEP